MCFQMQHFSLEGIFSKKDQLWENYCALPTVCSCRTHILSASRAGEKLWVIKIKTRAHTGRFSLECINTSENSNGKGLFF